MKAKLCAYAGCAAVVTDGSYCQKHRIIVEQRRKASAFAGASHNSSLYNTGEWRKFRRQVLADCPHCERCGTSSAELHVHHIIPARDNIKLFFSPMNIMVLCESCHAAETQREIEHRRRNR